MHPLAGERTGSDDGERTGSDDGERTGSASGERTGKKFQESQWGLPASLVRRWGTAAVQCPANYADEIGPVAGDLGCRPVAVNLAVVFVGSWWSGLG
ncbi:unnamed protein product [Linum trigynum]|uniref:Uncharacterized protein n=1 Tax=Linum trigynum TaxID=586398 RepID=A0AAV2FFT3_9ROSI